MTRTDSDRTTALKLLAHFRQHLLPGALRRVAAWKGVPKPLLRDWEDDVQQELALDTLEHASTIVTLGQRDRHARWMRCTDRTIYRLHRQTTCHAPLKEDPRTAANLAPEIPAADLPALVTLNNGRTNIIGSIRQSGQARRTLRKQLDELAAKLGWDRERQDFWQARVAEALTGLAADLLREAKTVWLLDAPRALPDSQSRCARLRQLSRRFPVQPSTFAVRCVLRPWLKRCDPASIAPRRLLEQAADLQPHAASLWLWMFEACCAEQDQCGALRALRAARQCPDAPYSAIVLSRARLLELRGRTTAGVLLIRRAASRWPREATLTRALKVIEATATNCEQR